MSEFYLSAGGSNSMVAWITVIIICSYWLVTTEWKHYLELLEGKVLPGVAALNEEEAKVDA